MEWTEDKIKELQSLAGYGLNQHDIADFFKIDRAKYQKALKVNDAVRLAVSNGRATAKAALTQKAYQMAKAGDRTMLIFWLKTQCGFREERAPVEITTNEGKLTIDLSGSSFDISSPSKTD